MFPDIGVLLMWLVAAGSLFVIVSLLLSKPKDSVDRRLADLGMGGDAAGDAPEFRGGFAGPAGPLGTAATALPTPLDRWTTRRLQQQERKRNSSERMMQAGLYTPGAAGVFAVLRIALLLGPAVLGFVASTLGLCSMLQGVVIGAIAGLAGTLAPGIWVDHVKRSRQTNIRRALPDALDVMVICLQGGLSLQAALSRVARELATAHPMLALELNIVQRQIQMGRGTGEAVREMALRFDLEELRTMASVLVQAERLGTSMVGAFEVFADSLRLQRQQRAEEMAHKAGVKMMFPTLLFIFPAIFIVVLGPAAIQIYHQFILEAMGGQ